MSVHSIGRRAFAVAAAVFLVSYAWLAVSHGSFWIGHAIVHENGRLTWWGTVFYFEHFLREWPIDVSMALFAAAAARMVLGARVRSSPSLAAAAGALAVVLVGGAVVVTAMSDGTSAVADSVWQRVTREGASGRGSHWHSHWLAVAWFGCAAGLVARAVAIATVPAPANARPLLWAWIWFAAVTAIFGMSLDTFTSARYLGHQAREIATHAIVTVPIVAGVVLRRVAPGDQIRVRASKPWRGWAVATVAIPVFLVVAAFDRGAADEAQMTAGWAGVGAAHVFEHTLDYLLVSVLTVAFLHRRVGWPA